MTRRRNHNGWFGTSVTLALALAGVAAGATHITVRDRAVLSAAVVRLGDVAEVAAADRVVGRSLSAMPLIPAPARGSERYLTVQELKELLAARGLDLSKFQFDGAARIAISTSAANANVNAPVRESVTTIRPAIGEPMNRHAAILAGHVDHRSAGPLDASTEARLQDELNQSIASFLESQTGRAGNWQVSCNVPSRHLASLNAATSAITCKGGREPWVGSQRFNVSFTTPQGAVQFPVYAQVTAASATSAVVASRPIAKGDVITAADVEMQVVETAPPSNARRAPLDSVEKLIGLEARQAILAGETVFTDQVQSPQLVKRGDVIAVVSQAGGIRVRTTARARQDGARGQLVQVESLESKERYDVRVVGFREAAVFTASGLSITEPAPLQIETARR